MMEKKTSDYNRELMRLSKILQRERKLHIKELFGSSKAFFIANLKRTTERTLIVLAGKEQEAEQLYADIVFFLGETREKGPGTVHTKREVFRFPSWETLPQDPSPPHSAIVGERIDVLDRFLQKEPIIVIVTLEALLQKVIQPEKLERHAIEIKKKEAVDREEMIERLVRCGYRREGLVEEKGTFSARGGIVDIYPLTEELPVRVEFFGEEIETIRDFNPETQRSTGNREQARILPAREMIFKEQEEIRKAIGKTENGENRASELLERVETENFFSNTEYFEALFQPLTEIFDYFPEDAVLIADHIEELRKRAEHYFKKTEKIAGNAERKEKKVFDQNLLYLRPEELEASIKKTVKINTGIFSLAGAAEISGHPFSGSGVGLYQGRFQEFISRLEGWIGKGFRAVIVCFSPGKAKVLGRLLEDYRIASSLTEKGSFDIISFEKHFHRQPVVIATGELSSGFLLSAERLVFVSEKEVFGPKKVQRYKKTAKGEGFITTFKELKEGDYIVHIDYGIGKYLGVKQLGSENVEGEFLQIEYAGSEMLYVPVNKTNRVQKYVGTGDGGPRLDRLGDSRWVKLKMRVKKSLKETAKELLNLYAFRERAKGFAFSSDGPWHREFDLSFEYEETEHQREAIEEVKADMEKETPMDRLVCGDVGYGKTEVAMRAAFKAVMDGKQVAMLVPTTILAQQHYHTFSYRFSPYPVKVEMISRFKTSKEQRSIIERLKKGEVDIIIGTHRLLQKDVSFKSLGLIIIDEEQRFGVVDKEKLKSIRKSVDALTLTATPIPRTLHFSLSGIRNMSIIDTPPEERLSIKTCIGKFDREVVREAILRELERDGQVYFVHNKVEDIEAMQKMLEEIVPEAKSVIAHGQMSEKELERTMLRFLNREFDLLLCTTIIESGLDIPSVNTIIINKADHFGLAQLYQLRGRVGRDRHQAYAYLLIPPESLLSYDAKKRLEAIEELSELGSGFRLATRDMEIRGTGNILGTQQSGHIAAVGFDLYCKLLKEAVDEIKEGGAKEEIPEPEIRLNISGSIPTTFIQNTNERLEIYKKLASLKNIQGLKKLREEIRDIYGAIPPETRRSLSLQEIRVMAQEKGIEKIEKKGEKILLVFRKKKDPPSEEMLQNLRETAVEALSLDKRTMQINAGKTGWKSVLSLIKKTLRGINECDTISNHKKREKKK